MLEVLGRVLGNSHFEAYIGGPLAGFIVSVIFSSFGKPPPCNGIGSYQSPQETRERIEKLRYRPQTQSTRVIHHHHYNRTGTGDEGPALIIVAGILLLVALFLFAAYLPHIAGTLYFFITSVSMFSVTSTLLAYVTGRFNTREWWLNAIFPSVISLVCLWLTLEAYQAISADVTQYAQNLLGDKPMTIPIVIGGAFKFFQSLGGNYAQWMLFDMLAFICISICAALAFFQCVYYISLSNTRVDGGTGWQNLALWTERFSSKNTAVFMLILIVAAWFLASGGMYQLTH